MRSLDAAAPRGTPEPPQHAPRRGGDARRHGLERAARQRGRRGARRRGLSRARSRSRRGAHAALPARARGGGPDVASPRATPDGSSPVPDGIDSREGRLSGTLLALLFGPLGLLYAGPLEEVAVGFAGFLALLFASSIPLIGGLAGAFIPFVWLASIAVQIVYVARFNANGQRTALFSRSGWRALRRFRA